MSKPKFNDDSDGKKVHVDKPTSTGKTEKAPPGSATGGDDRETGGYHGPTTKDNGMNTGRTGA